MRFSVRASAAVFVHIGSSNRIGSDDLATTRSRRFFRTLQSHKTRAGLNVARTFLSLSYMILLHQVILHNVTHFSLFHDALMSKCLEGNDTMVHRLSSDTAYTSDEVLIYESSWLR